MYVNVFTYKGAVKFQREIEYTYPKKQVSGKISEQKWAHCRKDFNPLKWSLRSLMSNHLKGR